MSELTTTHSIESSGYAVFFGAAGPELGLLLKSINPSAVFILADTNTAMHCLPLLLKALPVLQKAPVMEIQAGEGYKNIETTTRIWEFLLSQKADRNALLLNLGGGVLTDMGAFAASTYKRGIPFIQIPTTLLSQVDASVGGKTGIDFHGEKNMIGTFTQPQAVVIDETFLETLEPRELVSGAAELIKHGLISDSALFELLRAELAGWLKAGQLPSDVLRKSISLKNKVVLEDPFEKNIRKILNFGHTIGHALETWSMENDADPLRHGEAIGIGMICESWLSSHKAGLDAREMNEISSFLASFYGGRSIDPSIFTMLFALMQNDKKNEKGLVNFSLLERTGKAGINYTCSQEDIFSSMIFYNKNFVF